MIYALIQKHLPESDRHRIAEAIVARKSDELARWAAAKAIIHVMDFNAGRHQGAETYCVYCLIRLFATTARGPQGREGLQPWHFEHRREGDEPGWCKGHVRVPPRPHALSVLNPAGQGCYIEMGFEHDDHGNPTDRHRTKCRTIDHDATYCHHALAQGCIERPGRGGRRSEAVNESGNPG